MATRDQRDEALWAAIDSGTLEGPFADDTETAQTFAAYQKLESLFELIRQPADVLSQMQEPIEHPETIGRYRVRRVLGQGAFGIVYLADDPELDRLVAVKVPRPGRFSSEDETEKFLEEARLAARLNHPGIVTVHDVGREGDQCYIVTEYIQGRTLQELADSESLHPAEAAGLVARVADALHYAHKKGFVHRDLKPGNILIDDQGHPHVVDFGLAVSEDSQRLHAGQIAGTPAYMSPEQVRGETQYVDGRTDIWSLGVILYQMLTGRQPFWRGTAAECLDEIQQRDPKPPRQIDDSIPAELERIVLKCLAKRTTERYNTSADLAGDLRRWHPSPHKSSASGAPLYVGSSHRFRKPAWWIIGCVALIAGILTIYAATRPVTPSGTGTTAPITGTIGVKIWNSENPQRRELSLTDKGALPLISGDHIRVTASANRPSYLYVVWIDSQGEASPVYPWAPGDWASRPEKEEPVASISLPDGRSTGWPMQGPSGMETLVLLARETPLPADVQLQELFSGFPIQKIQDPRAIVWLDKGEIVDTVERKPQFFNPQEIDDPVLVTQRLLAERLGPHFQLVRAVSFANVVPAEK
ncbi:MAG: protein kinase [Candidatus Nealsonbacteria bacterium]|nr:protein kinase [Candidatus Nealsonbacteria bacterium]